MKHTKYLHHPNHIFKELSHEYVLFMVKKPTITHLFQNQNYIFDARHIEFSWIFFEVLKLQASS